MPAIIVILALSMTLAACSSLTGTSSGDTSPTPTPVPLATPTPNPSTKGKADQGAHPIIAIKDFSFTPAVVTVKVGSRVVWQNEGQAPHTVAFDDGSVLSPDIPPGKVAGHTFAKAGTFKYHCSLHPQMKGTVIVK